MLRQMLIFPEPTPFRLLTRGERTGAKLDGGMGGCDPPPKKKKRIIWIGRAIKDFK